MINCKREIVQHVVSLFLSSCILTNYTQYQYYTQTFSFASSRSFSSRVMTWLTAATKSKTRTWSAVNFKKKLNHSMSSKPEPAMQIPCFDKCQLIRTWMSNIKNAPIIMAQLLFFKNNATQHIFGIITNIFSV